MEKSMFKQLLLTTIALIPIITSAQSKEVFGFELGKPLNIQECPFKNIGKIKLYEITPAKTCIEDAQPLNGYGQPVRRITLSQEENSPIVKNWRIFPLEENGVLIGLHFLTPGVNAQDLALAQLKEKYGTPTLLEKRGIQNIAGATFQAISAQWKFKDIQVSFEGVTGKIETGEVYIDLPEAVRLRSEWKQKIHANERKL
jgi:hypothetical protein